MQNIVEPSAVLPRKLVISKPSTAAQRSAVRWAIFTKYFLKFWWTGSEEERTAWLRQRLALFRTYCMPSVLAQRESLQCWYVFAEDSLVPELSEELAPLVAENKVRFLSADSVADFQATVTQSVDTLKSALGPGERLLCTRLDNDDALSLDFHAVASSIVMEAGDQVEGRLLSFSFGAQLERATSIARAHVFTNNHFLCSVHSPRSEAAPNCLSFNHSNLFSEVPQTLVFPTRHPMWLEIVHGDNLRNRAINGLALPTQEVLERFLPTASPSEDTGEGEASASPQRAGAASTGVLEAASAERRRLNELVRVAIAESGAMKPPVFADVYASVLSRQVPRHLFEIGIHQGGSIRLWRRLLGAQARLACMDIKADCCRNAHGVADHVYEGSQIDADLLKRIGQEAGPFDVIIDDGSHQNPHMIFTLQEAFALVRPGGAYVIEDMFTSYWPRYRGGLHKPDALMEFLKARLDGLYAPFLKERYRTHFLDAPLPSLPADAIASQVESIEFFGAGIVVLHKRAAA